MSRAEIAERRHLRNWLDQSLIEMDTDALRFLACVAAIRVMNEGELDKLQKHMDERLKKDKTKA
jgi:hypothetical protein